MSRPGLPYRMLLYGVSAAGVELNVLTAMVFLHVGVSMYAARAEAPAKLTVWLTYAGTANVVFGVSFVVAATLLLTTYCTAVFAVRIGSENTRKRVGRALVWIGMLYLAASMVYDDIEAGVTSIAGTEAGRALLDEIAVSTPLFHPQSFSELISLASALSLAAVVSTVAALAATLITVRRMRGQQLP